MSKKKKKFFRFRFLYKYLELGSITTYLVMSIEDLVNFKLPISWSTYKRHCNTIEDAISAGILEIKDSGETGE